MFDWSSHLRATFAGERRFQNPRVCLQEFPSFPSPTPSRDPISRRENAVPWSFFDTQPQTTFGSVCNRELREAVKSWDNGRVWFGRLYRTRLRPQSGCYIPNKIMAYFVIIKNSPLLYLVLEATKFHLESHKVLCSP